MSDAPYRLVLGDALESLRHLEAGSVQTCVTSPPYWGLRDYGVAGQLGLEATPDEYVAKLVAVFREVRRVLREDGTAWLNLGDCYAAGKTGRADGNRLGVDGFNGGVKYEGEAFRQRSAPPGLKPKDLIGMPWRVAFALQADGWWLRSDIVWCKKAPMPESVTDRPTRAHEYLFLLAKAERYFYDAEAILEPFADERRGCPGGRHNRYEAPGAKDVGPWQDWKSTSDGKNRRSWWLLGPEPFPAAHFAVMPTALVAPCILAGSREGDTVLDPFCGAGTVGVVAKKLGRSFIGIELNPEYADLARTRIEGRPVVEPEDAPAQGRLFA